MRLPEPHEEIRGLALNPPYSIAIPGGYKHIETRTRKIHYRGWIAVYSTKNKTEANRAFARSEPCAHYIRAMGYEAEEEGKEPIDAIPAGAFIGLARVSDCLAVNDPALNIGAAERLFGDYSPGRYAWGLTDICRLREPIYPPYDVHSCFQGLFPILPGLRERILNRAEECPRPGISARNAALWRPGDTYQALTGNAPFEYESVAVLFTQETGPLCVCRHCADRFTWALLDDMPNFLADYTRVNGVCQVCSPGPVAQAQAERLVANRVKGGDGGAAARTAYRTGRFVVESVSPAPDWVRNFIGRAYIGIDPAAPGGDVSVKVPLPSDCEGPRLGYTDDLGSRPFSEEAPGIVAYFERRAAKAAGNGPQAPGEATNAPAPVNTGEEESVFYGGERWGGNQFVERIAAEARRMEESAAQEGGEDG